jgi:hypothetical protein
LNAAKPIATHGQHRRYRIQGGSDFLTMVQADRTRGLLTEHIASLRDAFWKVRAQHPLEME